MINYHSIHTNAFIIGVDDSCTALQPIEGTLLYKVKPDPEAVKIGSAESGYAPFTADSPFVADNESILRKRCELLLKSSKMVADARWPYTKSDPLQEYVYERKYIDARSFEAMGFQTPDIRASLPYLADEVDLLNRPAKEIALEIIRIRSEREEVLRYSEKARRYFIDKICRAHSLQQLQVVESLMIEKRYRLDCTA
jgi:hypothetical protein